MWKEVVRVVDMGAIWLQPHGAVLRAWRDADSIRGMQTRRRIVAMITLGMVPLAGRGFAEKPAKDPVVMLIGEVENPGPIRLTDAPNLQSIFNGIAKVTSMGSLQRVRLIRDGTLREYNLRRQFPDLPLRQNDIVEVIIKSVVEGGPLDGCIVLSCKDPWATMRSIEDLTIDTWVVRKEWRVATLSGSRELVEGVAFRPTLMPEGGHPVGARVMVSIPPKGESRFSIDRLVPMVPPGVDETKVLFVHLQHVFKDGRFSKSVMDRIRALPGVDVIPR